MKDYNKPEVELVLFETENVTTDVEYDDQNGGL